MIPSNGDSALEREATTAIDHATMNTPQKQLPITRFMQQRQLDIVVVSSDNEAGNNAGFPRTAPATPMNGRRRRIIESDDEGLDLTTAPAPNGSATPAREATASAAPINSDNEDTDGNFAVILREPDVGQLPPSARHKTPPRQVEHRRPTRSQNKRRRPAVRASVPVAESVVYCRRHTLLTA
jgi:hypothetical protein